MALNPAVVERIARSIGLKVWPSFVERCSCTKKEIFLNGGWRGGKSASAAFIVLTQVALVLLQKEGTHLIWLVGPTYNQTHEEYGYLQAWAMRLGWQVEASTAQTGSRRMVITFPGAAGTIQIDTKSAEDPNSLGSVAPVIILACEAGQFSNEARMWIAGRQSEKNAMIIWSGTFHNDQGKPQYTWYEEESAAVKAMPTARRQAFALPSWENDYLYGNCLEGDNSILNDPTLAEMCPDGEHPHGGLDHPIMRIRKLECRDDDDMWDKRYAGIPVGVLNPVYPWSKKDSIEDFSQNIRLVSMSAVQKKLGVDFKWHETAGGIDPGLVHPAALCVTSKNQLGQYWTRFAVKDESGSADSMWAHKQHLQRIFQVRRWGGDPAGLKYTPSYQNIDAMTGSLYARESRVKIINGLAMPRHDAPDGLLFIDADVPANVLLFSEIQRVHRKTMADGSQRYDRIGEDMVASWENAHAELYENNLVSIPRTWDLPPKQRRSYNFQPARSVS